MRVGTSICVCICLRVSVYTCACATLRVGVVSEAKLKTERTCCLTFQRPETRVYWTRSTSPSSAESNAMSPTGTRASWPTIWSALGIRRVERTLARATPEDPWSAWRRDGGNSLDWPAGDTTVLCRTTQASTHELLDILDGYKRRLIVSRKEEACSVKI